MKLAVCSDLHLEFGHGALINEEGADVLVLAGDVCVAEDLKRYPADYVHPSGSQLSPRYVAAMIYRDFFLDCAKQFKHVVYVLGNHEHYEGEYDATYAILKAELAAIAPNVHLLEREAVELDGVLFLGATLWTDMFKGDELAKYRAQERMSDYRVIRVAEKGYRKLRPLDTMHDHSLSIRYLKRTLDANRQADKRPVVVVTHHAPCAMSLAECYRGDMLNAAYYTDLSEFIFDNPEVQLWCHGHLHNPSDYVLGATRVVCQPRGYYGEEHRERKIELRYVTL